ATTGRANEGDELSLHHAEGNVGKRGEGFAALVGPWKPLGRVNNLDTRTHRGVHGWACGRRAGDPPIAVLGHQIAAPLHRTIKLGCVRGTCPPTVLRADGRSPG